GAVPLLDLLLPKDGTFHRGMKLEPHQQPDPILAGESLHDVIAVLPGALEQIAGDARVQRSVAVACEQVDGWLLLHAHSLRKMDWIPACAGMTVRVGWSSGSLPPPRLHRPHEPQHVRMVVVHRRRRDTDHVRL